MKKIYLPNDLILFISGVPGSGKTTISYELLKQFSEFRLIEETDLTREVLRGYHALLKETISLPDKYIIYSHEKFFDYDTAYQQCNVMKSSICEIVKRQKRKRIPIIINGVHIIPEALYSTLNFSNILYINLYISSKSTLEKRLSNRDPKKYTETAISLCYRTNKLLHENTCALSKVHKNVSSIDITDLSLDDTLLKITNIFRSLYEKN